MKIQITNKQAGFTLVEISIVLVIIGLLLGGVLAGTSLIDNARVRSAVSELNGTIAAYHSYRDRYRALPGDDGPLADLQARGNSWADITQASANPNGTLNVSRAQTFTGGNENDNFWQHLRAAGFITGDPSKQGREALPRSAFGGLLGITNQTMGGGLAGPKVCMTDVPGQAANSMDLQLDDGKPDAGQFRATQGTAGSNTAPANAALTTPYNEENVYTICMLM